MKAIVLTTAALIGWLGFAAIQPSDALAAPSRKAIAASNIQVRHDGRIIIVRRRPPARRIEVRSHRPSVRHVWIEGHWAYHRKQYVWVKGHWIVPPRRGAVYVRPRWHRHGGGYVFVRGRWQ